MGRLGKKILGVFVSSLLVVPPQYVLALPEGESVVSGSATFDRSNLNTLNINTPSDKLIVNYDSFSIGSPESVNFNQPSSSSIALNRVVGTNPSQILGNLTANGQVWVVNPNGVYFSNSARVDAAGLVASTLDINNNDFLNGQYKFFQNGAPSWVINDGQINVTNGGYVALLSNAVANNGAITANLGNVVLASGEKVAVANLDDAGDVSVSIEEAVKNNVFGPDGQKITDAIKNTGSAIADGGKVLLSAKVLNNIFDYAVNQSGTVQANSLVNNNGVIELVAEGSVIAANAGSVTSAKAAGENGEGGSITFYNHNGDTTIRQGAVVDVSGGSVSGDAGFIEFSATENLGLNSTQIYTDSAFGYKRGTILIDPRDIRIQLNGTDTPTRDVGGLDNPDEAYGDHSGLDIIINPAALAAMSSDIVYLQATRDIFINDTVSLNTLLRLDAQGNINFNAPVTSNGLYSVSLGDTNINSTLINGTGNGFGFQIGALGNINIASTANIVTNNSQVVLNSVGNLNVNTDIDTQGGYLEMVANYFRDAAGVLNFGAVDINSGGGLINLGGTSINSTTAFFDGGPIEAASATGNISLQSHGGMEVGSITAANGNVALTAQGGAIIDAVDNGENTMITGNQLLLSGSNGIGTEARPLHIMTNQVSVANGGSGGINLLETKTGELILMANVPVTMTSGNDTGGDLSVHVTNGTVDSQAVSLTNGSTFNLNNSDATVLTTGDDQPQLTTNNVSANGHVQIRVADNRNLRLDGTVSSSANAVDLTVDQGDITAVGVGPHVVADLASRFATPAGTQGVGNPVNVAISDALTLLIGDQAGGVSGQFTGSANAVVLENTPPGTVTFNGTPVGTGTNTGVSTGTDTGVSTGTDTGVSTGTDTGVSTGTDTGVSTGTDTGVSTGTDTGVSTGTDTGVSTGTDTGVSTGTDTGVSTGTDTGVSTGTDTGVSTGTDTGVSTGTDTGVSTGTDTGVSTGTDTGVSTGTDTGVSTGTDTGVSTGTDTGVSTGTSTGVSTGTSTGVSTGTSTGVSTGTSTGVSTGTSTGVSTGTSTGVSTGTSTGVSTGTSTGTGTGSTATGTTPAADVTAAAGLTIPQLIAAASSLALSDQLAVGPGSVISTANLTGDVYFYHPLTEIDASAVTEEFQLEEGAYEFINGRITNGGAL
jgi:filamentous hemagglutinin family protein